MTREKMEFPNTFDEFVKSYGFKDNEEVYTNGSELIPVFRVKQWLDHIEPCEDAVSRQAVLQGMYDLCNTGETLKENPWRDNPHIDAIIDTIENSPPVTPKQKTGKYEWVQYDYNPKLGNWHCSECRCIVVECVEKNRKDGIPRYKYCPNCGAKMEGE